MNPVKAPIDTVATIQREVAAFYGLHHTAMLSRARPDHIAHPRQVAMCLARELTRLSLAEIGLYFGGRDHGTIIHATVAVRNRAETNLHYATELHAVWARVVEAVHGVHIRSA